MIFLSDTHVSTGILALIRDAQKFVLLITPYVQTWERLVTEVRRAVQRGVSVKIIVRYETTGGGDAKAHILKAKSLQDAGAEVFSIRRLHAKIYLNESRVITTSMNLVESSVLNSLEIAIGWNYQDQTKLTESVLVYVASLEREIEETAPKSGVSRTAKAPSTSQQVASKPPAKAKAPTKRLKEAPLADDEGCCLRCRAIVDYDPERPLCMGCYTTWQRYRDPNYIEKFCHACGSEHDSSMVRPLCLRCFRQEVGA